MTGPGLRRAVAVVVAATASLAFTSCGVPTRGSADRADPRDVPFGLLDTGPGQQAKSRTATASPVTIYSYDARDERLLRIVSDVEDTTLESVLRQLQAPASESGLPAGNPLDDAAVILSAEVSKGRAIVDLADEFNQISGTSQLIALAEIVYTATGRPGVGQVLFTLEGAPIDTPRGDGSLTSEPLTRSDFPRFAPAEPA